MWRSYNSRILVQTKRIDLPEWTHRSLSVSRVDLPTLPSLFVRKPRRDKTHCEKTKLTQKIRSIRPKNCEDLRETHAMRVRMLRALLQSHQTTMASVEPVRGRETRRQSRRAHARRRRRRV